MRAWCVLLAVVLVAAAGTHAVPLESDSEYTGSKTIKALKEWFRPVTTYFNKIPNKTPSDVADDVGDKFTDVKEWVRENEVVQGLYASLEPARTWLKEQGNDLSDQSFKEMYDNLKEQVMNIDTMVGSWIQDHNESKK